MKFPVSPALSMHILRFMISLTMFVHGTTRLISGTVNGFGDFLNAQGFLIGTAIAWGITLFEVIGAIVLLFRFFTKWISLIWALQLLMGIFLVHLENGWFVVGASTGGVEYSLLLIAVCIAVASHDAKSQ